MMASNFAEEPPLGVPSFFGALVSYIRTASPALPLDPIILQSVLACLIAGNKNLILRTGEADVGLVLKLVTLILSTIFGLPTHRLKIRTLPTSPTTDTPERLRNIFLRSLFLPAYPASANSTSASNSNSADDISNIASSRRHNAHRTRRDSHKKSAPSPTARSVSFTRSYSFPADLRIDTGVRVAPYDPSEEYDYVTTPTNTSNKFSSDLNTHSHMSASFPSQRRPHHTHSDQSSTAPHGRLGGSQLVLPQALVMSGLEHASMPAQRALLDVLKERRVVLERTSRAQGLGGSQTTSRSTAELSASGKRKQEAFRREDDLQEDGVWNLPDGFLVVYVCPLDIRERPSIHKTLLDKFSMSATVTVQEDTRRAARAYPFNLPFSHLPRIPSSPLIQHSTLLTSPTSSGLPARQSYHVPLPDSFLQTLRAHYQNTNVAPSLSLYASDLFSATRHHPELDGTLLTARARREIEDLARAGRVIGTDMTGAELIHTVAELAMGDEAEEMASHPSKSNSATLDVSEADIARMVPRVVSHRLRVRDGPEDEILGSAVFHAVGSQQKSEQAADGTEVNKEWERSSVKDILVQILSEV